MAPLIMSPVQRVEMLKRIAENPEIPSPPMVVMRVLEQSSKPDCTIDDLCQILPLDPGLSANILRIVNSALFGMSRPVTSIQRALAMVGLNSARLLVLAISFPKMHMAVKGNTSGMQRYWKSSIVGAIVARALAQRFNVRDSEDDMAAGLLRDLGEIILQQLFLDAVSPIYEAPAETLIREQCQMEENACGLNHAEVSAFILNRWRLPAEMTEAIHFHHDPQSGLFSSARAEERAHRLHFATCAAHLLLFPDEPSAAKNLMELAQARFGMDEPAVRDFLIPLSRKITEFAAIIQVDIGPNNNYSAVLPRVSEELVNLAASTNQEQQNAREMIRRAESEVRHWKQEAIFDPLTKVCNRRYLESRLQELCSQPIDARQSFGILFIDLDGFKGLNDRFGHAFGDMVLQQVADCLTRQVRQGDLVARYGGDEFCILFAPLNSVTIQNLAERIWTAINELSFRRGESEGKVGASIGAVHCDTLSSPQNPDSILAAADHAMYQAKSRGKNRVVHMGSLSGLLRTPAGQESGVRGQGSEIGLPTPAS